MKRNNKTRFAWITWLPSGPWEFVRWTKRGECDYALFVNPYKHVQTFDAETAYCQLNPKRVRVSIKKWGKPIDEEHRKIVNSKRDMNQFIEQQLPVMSQSGDLLLEPDTQIT